MDLLHDPLDGFTDEINRRQEELEDLSSDVELSKPLVKPIDYLTEHLGNLEDAGIHTGKCREQSPNDMRGNCKDNLTDFRDDRP